LVATATKSKVLAAYKIALNNENT